MRIAGADRPLGRHIVIGIPTTPSAYPIREAADTAEEAEGRAADIRAALREHGQAESLILLTYHAFTSS